MVIVCILPTDNTILRLIHGHGKMEFQQALYFNIKIGPIIEKKTNEAPFSLDRQQKMLTDFAKNRLRIHYREICII